MTIGRGAGPEGLNLQVIPFRERTDWREAAMLPGSLAWQVIDIFTTHNGSWDVESRAAIRAAQSSKAERREENEAVLAGPLFGIDQWARDKYLFPPNDPRYNSDGGADHNIEVCVQDESGARVAGAGIVFTSNGVGDLQPPGPDTVLRNTEPHGWGNIPIFAPASYPPALGPWSASKLSDLGAADIVTGMGLPWNWHVSTFIVYQATRWDAMQPAYATLREALLGEAAKNWAIELNPNAALQGAIFATGVPAFVPTTEEFDVTFGGIEYVAQGSEHLGNGTVRVWYCPKSNYANIRYETR